MTLCNDSSRPGTVCVPENGNLHKVLVIGGEGLAGADGLDAFPREIVLGRFSRADIVIVVLPGASCDLPLEIRLAGEGAEAEVSGIYVCASDEKARIAVNMFHEVPHCNSRQLFKGIASGSSKVDFYGKIVVKQDAQKTEAYQENHNLLLSEDAKVNTKPQLEIYADDVKCSHGATVGKLNEDEQFYMRSRGITLEDAKILQMISFLSPVMEHVADGSLREEIASATENSLRRLV
ncbi:MAG: SufD family Fe-S cluster assembly protein [Candidatus Cryptobacteroides sp.]